MKLNEGQNMDIPKDVIYILETLNNKGFEAYIVGGCVRDILLNTKPKDWDITTSAKPVEVKSLFDRTFDTGIQHGTITVVLNKENYEVTTYRVDGEYEDGRHPKGVEFTANLQEDLLRRDFTMNAIAYHPTEGYKDFFGGQEDIKNRIIRGVGNPATRFQEDGLRMLRCVRFSAQLGFSIEECTYTALCENIQLIEKISAERIRVEMEKLWLSKYADKMVFLWESGLLGCIDTKLNDEIVGNENFRNELLKQLDTCEKIPTFVWAVVMQNYTVKEAKKFFKKLKFDNYTMNRVCEYLKYLKIPMSESYYEMRKIIGELGAEITLEIIKLQKIIGVSTLLYSGEKIVGDIVANSDCCVIADLAVNGETLINMGVEKGKKMGDILKYLLDEVHKKPELNNVDELEKMVRGIISK